MPIRLTSLTHLLLEINAAADTGQYDHITVKDVHGAIKRGQVLRFLKDSCKTDIDLSLLLDSKDPEFERWYERSLQDIYGGYAGNERRKWGVENRGMNLLIAWTTEIIQQREGIVFERSV